ncbi:hypothetical protein Tco_0910386 [Tanacetum coccineum]|uniref:Uncharacterized protein n=1 Tax=Tanacetum coccineum TaxID=301880 RepID=A0ABQ5CSP8_9ASTR
MGYEKTSTKADILQGLLCSTIEVSNPHPYTMPECQKDVFLDNQVDDMTSHHTKYTSPALTQKVFANMRRVGKGFSGNETPLFDTMLVQPQTQEDEDVEMPRKVDALEKDKLAQATEILSLKKRVEKLEKRRKSKPLVLRRLRKIGSATRVESLEEANFIVDETQKAGDDMIFDTTADLVEKMFTHGSKLNHRDFEEIRGLYNKEKELVDTFVAIGSKEDERRIKDLNTKAEEEGSNKDVDSKQIREREKIYADARGA